MKQLTLVVAFIMALVTPGLCSDNPWTGKLPFKEGMIRYELSGMASGETILYVRDYGATTVEYSTEIADFGGEKHIQKTINLNTPDWDYHLDLTDKAGKKTVSYVNSLNAAFDALSPAQKKAFINNNEKLGLGLAGCGVGYITKHAAKVLGYDCDKLVDSMGIEYLVFTGTNLALKTVLQNPRPGLLDIAVEIKLGPVDDARFVLPPEIPITHKTSSDEDIRRMAQKDINKVLKGKKQ